MTVPVTTVITHTKTVPSQGCPEDKPYYINVSDGVWKCAEQNEYDAYKKNTDTSFNICIGIFVFMAILMSVLMFIF